MTFSMTTVIKVDNQAKLVEATEVDAVVMVDGIAMVGETAKTAIIKYIMRILALLFMAAQMKGTNFHPPLGDNYRPIPTRAKEIVSGAVIFII